MPAVCLLEKLPEQSKLTCNLASPSKSSTLTRLHTAMAGYHCTISCESCDRCCELPLLPLKAKQEGLEGRRDVVEEAVFFFRCSSTRLHRVNQRGHCRASAWLVCRANVLFTNYSIKSSADKLLVYITLFLSSCLKRECCALQLKLPCCSATKIVLLSGNPEEQQQDSI